MFVAGIQTLRPVAQVLCPEHLSLKIQYVEFDINVPLRQQYIENLMSKIYDIELLIWMLL